MFLYMPIKCLCLQARTRIIKMLFNMTASSLEAIQQQSNALSAATEIKDEVNQEAQVISTLRFAMEFMYLLNQRNVNR